MAQARRKTAYPDFGAGLETLETWTFDELKRAVLLPQQLSGWESAPYANEQAKRVLLGAARELRLAALRVIAEQMRQVANRGRISWAGTSHSPTVHARVLFLLEQLSSEQLPRPTGDLAWQQRFAVEEFVLYMFFDKCFENTLYGGRFSKEHFSVFQRIWECTTVLPENRYSSARDFIELYEAFWRRFVDKGKSGPLGAHMDLLLRTRTYSNTPEEFSEDLREFVDGVCAWLIRDKENDDLLHYVRRYGFSKTRQILEKRFWEMILEAAYLHASGAEARAAFMERPVQWVFGNTEACKRISNRVVVSWCVMASRQIDGVLREPFEIPQWVRGTSYWKKIENYVESCS